MLSAGSASIPLSDPPGTSAIAAAVAWLEGALLGSVATTIAIVAIASIGLMMLAGRLNLRYGLTVIMGAFILFGAPVIAAGIQASLRGGGNAPPPAAPEAPPPMVAAPLPPPPPANRDPCAGAAVPAR